MERIGRIPLLNSDHPTTRVLLRQRDLFLAGKADPDFRPVAIAGPGVTLGAFGGEFFHHLAKEEVLKVLPGVGVSVGGCNLAYARSGQGEVILGAYRHLVRGPFINLRRFNKIIDVDYLVDEVFHGSVDPRELLDTQAVKNYPPGFWLATTEAESGKLRMFDAKSPDLDLFKVIKAAVAAPIISNKTIEIDGVKVADCISDMLPLDWVIDNLKPTDLLIQVNDTAKFIEHPFPASSYLLTEKLFGARFLSAGYRSAFLKRFQKYRRQLERLRQTNDQVEVEINGHKVRVGIVCLDRARGLSFSRDPLRVDSIGAEGKQKARLIFAR